MNHQQTLAGFEPPYKSEQSTYQKILPQLQATAKEIGANPDILSLKPAKTYSSVYYGNTLVFRLKIRGKSSYIEVPGTFKDLFKERIPANQQKISGDFLRINLEAGSVSDFTAELVNVLKDTINNFPKEWDCCSRYLIFLINWSIRKIIL